VPGPPLLSLNNVGSSWMVLGCFASIEGSQNIILATLRIVLGNLVRQSPLAFHGFRKRVTSFARHATDIPCDFKWQVFVSKDFQHGAHGGFSLVHPRLQVVAGGASGLSNFDHITLFTPFAPPAHCMDALRGQRLAGTHDYAGEAGPPDRD
jgi:hypothetical protein